MKNEEDRPLSSAYIDFTIVTRANGSASLHKFRLHVFFLYSALDASAHQSKSILRQKRKQSATDPIYIACQRCVCVVFDLFARVPTICIARVSTIRYTSKYREWKRESEGVSASEVKSSPFNIHQKPHVCVVCVLCLNKLMQN